MSPDAKQSTILSILKLGITQMTQSYSQLQKQIQALQLKAEKLRDKETEGVVARIRVAIEHYGLTTEQLFGKPSSRRTVSRPVAAAPRSAKYADGNGNSWGGMGKRPTWLRDALAAGRTLEEFATAGPGKAKRKSGAKKAKSSVRFRDDAGHTWSGMGPRPRWLREAIESGKTLEELTA